MDVLVREWVLPSSGSKGSKDVVIVFPEVVDGAEALNCCSTECENLNGMNSSSNLPSSSTTVMSDLTASSNTAFGGGNQIT